MVNGGGHFDMLVGSGAWAGRPLYVFFVRAAARGVDVESRNLDIVDMVDGVDVESRNVTCGR